MMSKRTEPASSPARLIMEDQRIDFSLGELRFEFANFLCLWSALIGLFCSNILNSTAGCTFWGAALGGFLGFRAFRPPTARKPSLPLAATLLCGLTVGALFAMFHEPAFRFAEPTLRIAERAGLLPNGILVSTVFAATFFLSRILAHLPGDTSRYYKLAPWLVLLLIVLKNRLQTL